MCAPDMAPSRKKRSISKGNHTDLGTPSNDLVFDRLSKGPSFKLDFAKLNKNNEKSTARLTSCRSAEKLTSGLYSDAV